MTDSRVVGLSEAARELGVCAMTVRRMLDRGLLKGERSPYGRVVDAQDLQRIAEARHERELAPA